MRLRHTFGFLLCMTLAPAPLAPAQAAPKTIEGNLQPDLLPEDAVWFVVFDLSRTLARGKTEPTDADAAHFINTYVNMSPSDARVFLQVGAATLAQVAQIEAVPRDGITSEAADQLAAQRTAAILAGRDSVQSGLSTGGKAALARFVAHVKHGMSVTE